MANIIPDMTETITQVVVQHLAEQEQSSSKQSQHEHSHIGVYFPIQNLKIYSKNNLYYYIFLS